MDTNVLVSALSKENSLPAFILALITANKKHFHPKASTAPVLSALGILLTLRLNLLFSIRQKSSRDACPHDSNNHVSSRNIV
jgi:hypothetical protein